MGLEDNDFEMIEMIDYEICHSQIGNEGRSNRQGGSKVQKVLKPKNRYREWVWLNERAGVVRKCDVWMIPTVCSPRKECIPKYGNGVEVRVTKDEEAKDMRNQGRNVVWPNMMERAGDGEPDA